MNATSSARSPRWQFRVLSGPLRGSVHSLNDRLGIGRANGSELQLVHESVSRQHAHVAIDQSGQTVLVDLVSRNGTFVDGHRVQRQVLRPHAIVRIADTELVYEPAAARGPTTQVLRGSEHAAVRLVGPDGVEHGGRRLDEIIEYRTLRARDRRGALEDPESRERFDALARCLRQPPDAEVHAEAERRAFWRFECALPATLRMASGVERPCQVDDLGVDGARITVTDHGLEFDEIVWLSLVLDADGRVHEQVLAARVAWAGEARLGLAFAGAPRAGRRLPDAPPRFDDRAPTVQMARPASGTQDMSLVIGSSPSRARHWPRPS